MCRFYDCRSAVIKKMKKHLRGEYIRGKPIEFREWEAELRDGLGLLAEDVPGVSSRDPQTPHQRAGDRATSSVERSAASPSHRHSGEYLTQRQRMYNDELLFNI
ncbi:hypothetical protein AB205_0197450 [Aquarana catesbeiana]|uniref:Uncharacterized protein n=1 Tax=Aquarana catesbeiana TaxID=8400 RepID=A0A2G9Q294_AQUCT|nr:hypothetical protein AB205_0197450 [Aquarana catesbeiana]